MKRVLFLLAVALVPLVAFAGGAAETKGDIPSLRFAHTWGEGDAKGPYFGPALAKFAAAHAGEFTIVTETASGDNMFNKIQVDLAGGSLPDIWTYWGGSRLVPLVDGGKLLTIDEYLAVTKNLKKSDFSDSAWNLYRVGNAVYGIPLEGYVAAFLVNSELFKKYNLSYPTTYEEMVKVGKVFQQNNIIPFAMGSQGGNPSHFWFSEVYTQFPGAVEELTNLPKTRQFATDNALRTAQLMADMKAQGLFPKDTLANGDWGPSFALYNEGRAAMIYTYPWMLGAMNKDMQDKSVPIAVPRMPGATQDPTKFISGGAVFGIVVNKASFESPAKQKALVALMDFMTSDQLFDQLIKGGLIPTKKYKMNTTSFNEVMQKVLAFTANMDKVTAHWWNIWDNTAAQTYQSSLDELFAGVISPKEFVDKVQASFKK